MDAKEFLKQFMPTTKYNGTPMYNEAAVIDLLTEFAGSKVKPVNEKMREALESLKKEIDTYKVGAEFSTQNLAKILGMERIIESALSTAPDDGWIPVEKELPKENGRYLCIDSNGLPNQQQQIYRFDNYMGRWFYNGSDECHPQFWQPLPKSPR